MFCKNCGKELPDGDGAKFCVRCGKSFTGDFTNDFSESQSQSTDYYVLVLLNYGSHFAKCRNALTKSLNLSYQEAQRALLSIRDNRKKGFVICTDKQLDIVEGFAAPFQNLRCNMKIFKINESQTVTFGTLVDLDDFKDSFSVPLRQLTNETQLKAADILDAPSIVSLAAGVVSFFSSPIIMSLVAIIAGSIALRRNFMNPLAKAGRVLGIISLVIGIISAIVVASIGGAVANYFLFS